MSEKKFKVYYAYIDYAEDDCEKTLPSEYDLEEEIVFAETAHEAIKKFKMLYRYINPDVLIDSVELVA